MKVHECVSFILLDGRRVLLEKRSEHKESDPGTVNIPGGHIEKGESQYQTLVRELKEELDITPEAHTYLCSLYHPTSEMQLIHYYVVERWLGEISACEAEEVIWYEAEQAPVDIEADKIALAELKRVYPLLSFSHSSGR